MKASNNEHFFIDLINQGYLEIDNDRKIWRIAKRYSNQFVKNLFIPTKRRYLEYKHGNGYLAVTIRINGKTITCLSHRIIWIYFNGKIPDGLEVNHKNGIKIDNQLENLELVTRSENHKHAFGIGLKNHKGEKSPVAKLIKNNIIEIRRRYENGEIQASIAKDFNICQQQISNIINGISWAHV